MRDSSEPRKEDRSTLSGGGQIQAALRTLGENWRIGQVHYEGWQRTLRQLETIGLLTTTPACSIALLSLTSIPRSNESTLCIKALRRIVLNV
jgi:hypothetical protein